MKQILREGGALPLARALEIAIQVSEGLGYAHRRGLVHADIKPQNLLITADGRAKITDFGIARVFRRAQPAEKSATVWGSPHYFAPEQALGAAPAPECDIYAMGIVLFEMLTGRLPYRGENQKELALAPCTRTGAAHQRLSPGNAAALTNIVKKLMSKDAAARYRSGEQLAHVLRAFREQGAQSTVSGSALPPMNGGCCRHAGAQAKSGARKRPALYRAPAEKSARGRGGRRRLRCADHPAGRAGGPGRGRPAGALRQFADGLAMDGGADYAGRVKSGEMRSAEISAEQGAERAHLLAWSRVRGVGPGSVARLRRHFGRLTEAWRAAESELRASGLRPDAVAAALRMRQKFEIERENRAAGAPGHRLAHAGG